MIIKKILLVIIFVSVLFVFLFFDVDAYLNFESLKQNQMQLHKLVDEYFLLAFVGYFIIYVLTTALSLPGAAILTIGSGAIFGLTSGVLLASFASSVGATLAFLLARFLFRDAVQRKFGDKLSTINKELEKDGLMYLFSLRLIPILPFFVINLLFALTHIRTLKFYWVSQLGMFAGTAVYVNAGTQLSQIQSSADILSPMLLFSFVLLGLFPFLAKKLLASIKKYQVYRPYKKPKSFDNNLVVIGAGSGGLVSAYIAAAVKAKVTLIEKHQMGGDCLNTGCVPSKALIKTSKIIQQIKSADKYGLTDANAKVDFNKVMKRVHQIIHQIEPHDSVDRYQNHGVNVIQGEAHIKSPYEVEVNGQIITTKHIIIATGASPFVPPIEGIESVGYYTSDTIWNMTKQPKHFLIIGGGPIGCELSQAFARLGSQVTLLQADDRLLPREDAEVSKFVQKHFAENQIQILTSSNAQKFITSKNKKTLFFQKDNATHTLEFDEVLLAVGRSANITGFGLETLGIKTERTVIANEWMATNFPNIFVAGDVTGPYQFTHTASYQAWFASVNALFGGIKKFKVDYRVIPKVTFTDPEIAQVGINEQDAKAQNISYECTTYGLDDLDRAITETADYGWIKVLTVPNKDKILGVTIVGDHAGEMIAEFVLAMKYGLGLNKILATVHAYPTWMEANKFAAGIWKKTHTSDRILRLLDRFHRFRRS